MATTRSISKALRESEEPQNSPRPSPSATRRRARTQKFQASAALSNPESPALSSHLPPASHPPPVTEKESQSAAASVNPFPVFGQSSAASANSLPVFGQAPAAPANPSANVFPAFGQVPAAPANPPPGFKHPGFTNVPQAPAAFVNPPPGFGYPTSFTTSATQAPTASVIPPPGFGYPTSFNPRVNNPSHGLGYSIPSDSHAGFGYPAQTAFTASTLGRRRRSPTPDVLTDARAQLNAVRNTDHEEELADIRRQLAEIHSRKSLHKDEGFSRPTLTRALDV